jgi:hypothetical protein
MSPRLAVFAYGSLASLASAERTLGRPVRSAGQARLAGWRRSWSQARDNLRSEKTFALADGTTPSHCLGLNVERRPGPEPNGALIEITEAELDRLAVREIRYDPVEVTDQIAAEIAAGARPAFDRVVTFTAKAENYAETPPPGSVILASYARAVEAAFESLGPGQLELYRESTEPHPVEVVEGVLVRDRIPAGNPREW